MKKLLLILLLVSSLHVFGQGYPKISVDGKEYYLYTVQKSEGFYAISQRFGVPQSVIIEVNPGAENGLKVGQIIKVPVEKNPFTTTVKEENKKPDFPVKTYTVRPKDTLYSLSKKYKVSVDDIIKVNPKAINLGIGDILYIPDSVAIKKELKKKEALERKEQTKKHNDLAKQAFEIQKDTIESTLDTLPTLLDSELYIDEIITKNYNGDFKVAILLPFMLDAPKRDASMDRFIDFYKGCIIAADSLSSLGYNIDIYSFDIGKTHSQISSVLNNPQLKQMDLIIGPAYQSQVSYVAKFAEENKIRTVIPFSSNVPEISTNKYLYQVVSPQKELYPILSEKFCSLFKDKLVIISQTESFTTYNKSEFTDLLLPQLKKNNIEYKHIDDYKIAAKVDSIAKMTEKEIIFLTPSSNEVLLNKLGEQLELITAKNVSVFAFPEWSGYQIDELYSLPIYSFTSYNTDYNNKETKRFFNIFIDKFGIPGVQQTPNYAIFGFDIFHFFINNMNKYGKRFDKHLEYISEEGIQMNFAFQKMGMGGHSNLGIIIQKIDANGLNTIE
jgi:LysM repeat protein